MSSSAQSVRCQDMGVWHRVYLLQWDQQECLYDLQLTTGSVLPMQSFLQTTWSLFVSIVMSARISVCPSKKRFLWGTHDVGSDSLRTETVLSIQVVGFPMFYYELQIKRELKGTHLCGCRFNDSNVGVHDYMWNSTLNSSYWNLFQQKTHSG